jgi:hypothetical protein
VSSEVTRTARYFVDHVRDLADGAYHSVRYEDLCRDPDAVIHCLLAFLGLPGNSELKYQDFIRVRERPRPANGDGDPSAILRRLDLQRYLAYCGYEAK